MLKKITNTSTKLKENLYLRTIFLSQWVLRIKDWEY